MNASQADVTLMPSATTLQAPSRASANLVITETAFTACLEVRCQRRLELVGHCRIREY